MNDDVTLLQERWAKLMSLLNTQFNKTLTLEGVVFLIGIRELGLPLREYEKEVKVDLMHIAICALLAPSGYYKLSHIDEEGWPHWIQEKPLPHLDLFSQEIVLKSHIIDYFSSIYSI